MKAKLNIRKISLFICISILFFACKKEKTKPSGQEHHYKTTVYVAGNSGNKAKYWKNGSPIYLTNGSNSASTIPIYVKDGKVYVAGYKTNSATETEVGYWKDGSWTGLTGFVSQGLAYALHVSKNNHVYVAGIINPGNTIYDQAMYWKDDASGAVTLANKGVARGIFTANGHVYIAGNEYNGSVSKAKYWIDDASNSVVLENGSNSQSTSIYVSGSNHVYVGGTYYNGSHSIAKVWEDGTEIYSLTNGTHDAAVYSVFVDDGDVYAAGYEENNAGEDVAKYWKNGNEEVLANKASATSIFVLDGDVFVAGHKTASQMGALPEAVYWENGSEFNMSDSTSTNHYQDIFVTKTSIN